jgi:hypothetical protein
MKKSSSIEAALFNAVWSGTRTKIVLRLADYNDASPVALGLFVGFVDYAEYKSGTDRPLAIGHEVVVANGSSQAEHEAFHEMQADSVMRGRAHAHGITIAESFGSGSGTGAGESAGEVLSPPVQLLSPNAPNASMIQYPLSENQGSSSSRSDFEQSSTSQTTSDVTIESEGEAHTHARGQSRGLSHATSATETYISKYEWMPSQLYSAAEQVERLTGEIMNLALRECFVKVDNQRPIRTRTADLVAPFRSDYAKRLIVPAFQKMLGHSPYLLPVSEVDALINGRALLPAAEPPPEPDFTVPEPMPVVDEPEKFAADFWRTRKLPGSHDEPPKSSKKPRGRFAVIDGDKQT